MYVCMIYMYDIYMYICVCIIHIYICIYTYTRTYIYIIRCCPIDGGNRAEFGVQEAVLGDFAGTGRELARALEEEGLGGRRQREGGRAEACDVAHAELEIEPVR